MDFLSRNDILGFDDITVKAIIVPDSIPVWGGKTLYIRQLSRGVQDLFLKRQYGETKMKQDMKAKQQEVSSVNLYGHDAFLCVRSICDPSGALLFKPVDEAALNEKSGEAIGWIAKEILIFSNMAEDAAAVKKTAEAELADEIKN